MKKKWTRGTTYLVAATLLTACGGGGGGPSPAPDPAPPSSPPVMATAPAITTQPGNASVTVGGPATFTVAASGSDPLSYQWQKNGSAISGATGASYTTPAASTADNGTMFSVVVTNTAGSATSNNAQLTVT